MLWFSVALVIGTFAADAATPMGVAVPVLYLLPVVLGLWSQSRNHAVQVAGVATILTVLGAILAAQRGYRARGHQPGVGAARRRRHGGGRDPHPTGEREPSPNDRDPRRNAVRPRPVGARVRHRP